MQSLGPILEEPLSPESEAATSKLEAIAHSLKQFAPPLNSSKRKRRNSAALLAEASDFLSQQAENLLELATQQDAILHSDLLENIRPISTNTTEVEVYPKGDRAYKVTKGIDIFGVAVSFSSNTPRTIILDGTPFEYLERLAMANRIFGDDNRFEGVLVDEQGHPHLVVSQHYFQSESPREIGWKEIDAFMTEKGFLTSDAAPWHRSDGTVALDAKPDNFKRKENEEIFPIDLVLLRVNPEKFKEWGWEDALEVKPPENDVVEAEKPRFPQLITGLKRLRLDHQKVTVKNQLLSL